MAIEHIAADLGFPKKESWNDQQVKESRIRYETMVRKHTYIKPDFLVDLKGRLPVAFIMSRIFRSGISRRLY